ncbi:MAG TPA: ABC transporter ATP-binding protein, partial [Pseudobacter sp.]|nr:ABC transporter ATP-binding protein [Pseudobacter sp.]
IVQVRDLSHRYGASWAIRDIGFEVGVSGVMGLLGSNGAGKSTTMNILCGVLNQTEGEVVINGFDMSKEPEQAKKQLGFLPQQAPLYLDLTVQEYLRFCAHLRNIPSRDIKNAVAVAMETCGIAHFRSRVINHLSGGYKQRVGIAQAIIHRPKLVVLDEPTNGLDPNQILEVRKLIWEIAADRAVIFSSHILSEVQATCRDIRMIEGGKMVFAGSMDDFNNYIQPNSILVQLQSPPTHEILKLITGVTGLQALEESRFRFRSEDVLATAAAIVAMSVQHGWDLVELVHEKSSLDEIFAQLSNKKRVVVYE